MIEVQLQPREKNHPALEHSLWWGRKGRFWDMEFIETANKEQVDTLHNALEEMIDLWVEIYNAPEIKDLIVDIEVCGSYAYGTQRVWSDFDIQLPAKDKEDQEKLANIFFSDAEKIKLSVFDLAKRLKHNIEVHFRTWDNKEYNEVYSLRERKLYNREPEIPMSENHQRKWSKETGRYEIKLRNKPFIEGDYWDGKGDEKYV